MLDRSSMWRCLCKTWILAIVNVLAHTWGSLIDLNLTSSHTVGNDVLSSLLAILHACDLSGSLTTALPHPLNCSNDFLVVLATRGRFICPLPLGLVNFELKHSIIRACSSSVRASANWSIGFIVQGRFSSRLMRHLRLSALGWVYATINRSAINRSMWSILIANL